MTLTLTLKSKMKKWSFLKKWPLQFGVSASGLYNCTSTIKRF